MTASWYGQWLNRPPQVDSNQPAIPPNTMPIGKNAWNQFSRFVFSSGYRAATSGFPVTSIMPFPAARVAAPPISIQNAEGSPTRVTAAIMSVMPMRCPAKASRAPFFSPNASSSGPMTSSEMAIPHSAAPPISPTW